MSMRSIIGVSALGHDAAIAVMNDSEIVFAAHAERYSRTKNDPLLSHALVHDALQYAGDPESIVFYERPIAKSLRRLRARQLVNVSTESPRKYLQQFSDLAGLPFRTVPHHLSHAAGAY